VKEAGTVDAPRPPASAAPDLSMFLREIVAMKRLRVGNGIRLWLVDMISDKIQRRQPLRTIFSIDFHEYTKFMLFPPAV